MSQQHNGHTETESRFKVSSKRLEKLGIKPVISGLVVLHLIHYTMVAPLTGWSGDAMVLGKLPVPECPTIWITVG